MAWTRFTKIGRTKMAFFDGAIGYVCDQLTAMRRVLCHALPGPRWTEDGQAPSSYRSPYGLVIFSGFTN
jgi:hypothetical protein